MRFVLMAMKLHSRDFVFEKSQKVKYTRLRLMKYVCALWCGAVRSVCMCMSRVSHRMYIYITNYDTTQYVGKQLCSSSNTPFLEKWHFRGSCIAYPSRASQRHFIVSQPKKAVCTLHTDQAGWWRWVTVCNSDTICDVRIRLQFQVYDIPNHFSFGS